MYDPAVGGIPNYYYADDHPYFFDASCEPQTSATLNVSRLHQMPEVEHSNGLSFSILPSQRPSVDDYATNWAMAEDGMPFEVFDTAMAGSNDLHCRANSFLGIQQHEAFDQSYPDTLEPRMMPQQYEHLPSADHLPQMVSEMADHEYRYNSCRPDQDTAPCFHVGYQEQYLLSDCEESSDTTICTPNSKHMDDDEMDKPYARLIYEALMQAPGHRMMLRDIYEWFKHNTTKPQESGTNGWQNSIRHNLSMNQAFENDKSDTRAMKGQPRKANSMWILTDYAIRHGVQSTTRYRKAGVVKKTTITRAPAIQRQRSGARGGRAARRSAARLRKEEEDKNTKEKKGYRPWISSSPPSPLAPPPPPQLQSPSPDGSDGTPVPVSDTAYQPATPADEHYPELLYGLPTPQYAFQHALLLKTDRNDFCGNEERISDYLQHATMEGDLDEVLKVGIE